LKQSSEKALWQLTQAKGAMMQGKPQRHNGNLKQSSEEAKSAFIRAGAHRIGSNFGN